MDANMLVDSCGGCVWLFKEFLRNFSLVFEVNILKLFSNNKILIHKLFLIRNFFLIWIKSSMIHRPIRKWNIPIRKASHPEARHNIPPTPSPWSHLSSRRRSFRPIPVHMYASRSASTCDIFHFISFSEHRQKIKDKEEKEGRRQKKLSSLLNQLFWGRNIFTTGCSRHPKVSYDVLEFR